MARPKGLAKTGGRKKGTRNKKTRDLESFLEKSGLNIPEKIMELIPSIEPEQQVHTLLKLMEFIYPKVKATDRLSLAYQEEVLSQGLSLDDLRRELTSLASNKPTESDSKPIVRILVPSNGREAP